MKPIAFLTFSLLSPSFGFVQLWLVVNLGNSTLLTEFSSWHGCFEIFRVSISLGEVNKRS